jgi:pyruvate dehydrogenase E2 component (dihydrolipoamide acetyltransferase)
MSEVLFPLPDVGEGLTEAEIVTWKVAIGDTVALNQPLCDIETAKATVELPSPYAGVIVALNGKPGDVIPVGDTLVTFEVAGSESPRAVVSEKKPDTPAREAVLVGYGVSTDETVATRHHRRRSAPATTVPGVAVAPTPTRAVAPRSTPPVRLYAKQHGIAIETVRGTGPEGLITRHDVEAVISGLDTPRVGAPAAPTHTTRLSGYELAPWSSGPAEERIPVRGVLRSMVDSMTKSAFTAPHAAVWLKVDATKTMELISSLKGRGAFASVRLSPLTLIAMAVCDGARHFPGINSSFDDTANEVVVRRSVNLGIAADTPRGLIVPNIKGADQLDLLSMARALNDLVDVARSGTTTVAAMSNTTLTITNVGPMGVDAAMPILPPGTGGILAVGQVTKTPWVVDDEIVIRQVVELCLSFDHRMIDGATASNYLAHVGSFLRDPAAALLAG